MQKSKSAYFVQVLHELPETLEIDVVNGEVFVLVHVVNVVPLNVDRNSGHSSLSQNLFGNRK